MRIKIKDTEQSRFNKRREYPDEMIVDLADSIKTYGLLSRIVFRSIGDGKYEVLAGWRRRLSLTKIRTIDGYLEEGEYVIMDVSDREAVKLSITENVQRINLSALDLADAIAAMREEDPKISVKEIAKILWMPEARVKRLLKIDDYVDKLPTSAINSLSEPDEAKPTLTDAHVDEMARAGAFENLDAIQVKDICDRISESEIPASKVSMLVSRAIEGAEKQTSSSPSNESSNSEASSNEMDKNTEEQAFTDKYNGFLRLDEGILLVEDKRESKELNMDNYLNYIRTPDKFRVKVKAEFKIQTLQ
jgi:ParB family chromosome partitioning protein